MGFTFTAMVLSRVCPNGPNGSSMKIFPFYSLFTGLAILSATANCQITLNPTPTRAVGQLNINQSAVNLVEGRELNTPYGIALDTTMTPPALYIADTSNNRVLGFRNATAFKNGQAADIVIGQIDLLSTSAQGPASVASGGRTTGLSSPSGMAVDKTGNLYIVDTGNNRILRFPAPFSHTAQFPDLVLGQTSFNTNTANAGAPSASTLNFSLAQGLSAAYVNFDAQGNLWAADAGNNRVLRFPATSLGASSNNGAAADIVLGQTDFVTTTYSNPLNDATTLTAIHEPTGVAFDKEGRLYISESVNGVRGRILIYNPPFAIGRAASRLIGVVPSTVLPQPPTVSEQQLGPGSGGLFILDDGVAIADAAYNRILVYDQVANFTSNNLTQQAIAVIGQPSFSVNLVNQGQPETAADRLFSPENAVATATEIYIADTGNNRVIVLPYSGSGQSTTVSPATRVIGQDQFYLNAPNLVEGKEFHFVSGSSVAAGVVVDFSANPPHLYVADTFNNRVLGFNDVRTVTFNSHADIVMGQPDFQRVLVNYPTNLSYQPNASGLNHPIGLALDSSGNLYVADAGNSRVVRFPAPFANAKALPQADIVLGQFSLTGPTITDASANTMAAPTGIAFASDNGLLVSDAVQNRVLFFAGSASKFTSGMAASKVFGQPNFTSTAGSTTQYNRFNAPNGISTDVDDRLYVTDTGNNRVVVFERAPAAGSDPSPAQVLPTPSGFSLNAPRGVFVNRTTGEIWVANTGNNQLLRYPQFNSLLLPNISITAIPSLGPLATTQDGFGNLYTADQANRVTINYPALTLVSAGSYVVGRALTPGSIGSIFGFTSQFATSAFQAQSLPLPTQLSNVKVVVNGIQSPLFYVGPSQINFQVPWEAPTSGTVDVLVQTTDTGQVLGDYPLFLDTASPALFTLNGQGTGQVAALNQDGTVNGPTNAAANGTYITFFGTGQGVVSGFPPDGTASSGVVPTPYTPQVIIGTGATNNPVPSSYVQYSGLAPGLVGVWQINVKIPDEVAPTSVTSITPVAIVANGIPSTGLATSRLVTTIWVKQPGK